MPAATLHVLGQRLRPLEPIATVGALLGLTRTTAYRVAERDGWPLVDVDSGRGRVSVAALLDRYQVPYTYTKEGADDE
jgi:hypothetical protein